VASENNNSLLPKHLLVYPRGEGSHHRVVVKASLHGAMPNVGKADCGMALGGQRGPPTCYRWTTKGHADRIGPDHPWEKGAQAALSATRQVKMLDASPAAFQQC
jgi:hypothetical protein